MAMVAKSSVMYDYLVTGKRGTKKPKPGKGGNVSGKNAGQGPNTGYGSHSKSEDNGPVVKKGGK